MGLISQLKSAYHASKPHQELDRWSDKAGRDGELAVVQQFERMPGVQIFQSLRVPEAHNKKERREIDIVFLTKRKLYVVEVKNWSGEIKLGKDGRWCHITQNGKERWNSNVVEETAHKANLLKGYLQKRGLKLPSGSVQSKVFLVNKNCRPEKSILNQSEVITCGYWENFLDEDLGTGTLGWVKSLVPGRKEDTFENSTYEKLCSLLQSTPTWDRVQLEGGRLIVGDFMKFTGKQDDVTTLQFVKRQDVSNLNMHHTRNLFSNVVGILFGKSPAVRIIPASRELHPVENRRKSATRVRPNTEIVFKPVGSRKPENFKLNNVVSMSLSI